VGNGEKGKTDKHIKMDCTRGKRGSKRRAAQVKDSNGKSDPTNGGVTREKKKKGSQ